VLIELPRVKAEAGQSLGLLVIVGRKARVIDPASLPDLSPARL
jgi:hypothetical protein